MAGILDVSPIVALMIFGLMFLAWGILGRTWNPLGGKSDSEPPMEIGRIQRVLVSVIGVALLATGVILLVPETPQTESPSGATGTEETPSAEDTPSDRELSPPTVILSPTEDAVVGAQLRVTGSAPLEHSGHLWPAVFSHDANRYYPMADPLVVAPEGSWSCTMTIGSGHDAGGRFDIIVLGADGSAHEELTGYASSCRQMDSWVGLDELPPGCGVLDTVEVVRD